MFLSSNKERNIREIDLSELMNRFDEQHLYMLEVHYLSWKIPTDVLVCDKEQLKQKLIAYDVYMVYENEYGEIIKLEDGDNISKSKIIFLEKIPKEANKYKNVNNS